MEVLKTILRQYGLAKDIRCNEMGDTGYRFGWLKSGGKGSLMRRLLSSMMSISTDVRHAGAGMYVSASSWQDAPTAPPLNTQPQSKLRHDAINGSIGSLDMAALHIGSLTDKMVLRKK